MGIDWFTLAAQIINFLVLVWLLQKVLYKPILNAMHKREQRIAASLEESRQKKIEAEAEKEKYISLQTELQASAGREMQKAREKAEAFRENLLRTTRDSIDANRAQWLASLEKEKDSFLRETSRTIADCFQQLAEKALRDLAGTELEERIVKVFLKELDNLSQTEKEKIGRAIAESKDPMVITSAFDLSSSSKKEISRKLEALWEHIVHKDFQVDQGLLAGINVEINGRKVKWDIAGYLQSFEKKLAESFEKLGAA